MRNSVSAWCYAAILTVLGGTVWGIVEIWQYAGRRSDCYEHDNLWFQHKDYHAPWTSTSYTHFGNVTIPSTVQHPEHWTATYRCDTHGYDFTKELPERDWRELPNAPEAR